MRHSTGRASGPAGPVIGRWAQLSVVVGLYALVLLGPLWPLWAVHDDEFPLRWATRLSGPDGPIWLPLIYAAALALVGGVGWRCARPMALSVRWSLAASLSGPVAVLVAVGLLGSSDRVWLWLAARQPQGSAEVQSLVLQHVIERKPQGLGGSVNTGRPRYTPDWVALTHPLDPARTLVLQTHLLPVDARGAHVLSNPGSALCSTMHTGTWGLQWMDRPRPCAPGTTGTPLAGLGLALMQPVLHDPLGGHLVAHAERSSPFTVAPEAADRQPPALGPIDAAGWRATAQAQQAPVSLYQHASYPGALLLHRAHGLWYHLPPFWRPAAPGTPAPPWWEPGQHTSTWFRFDQLQARLSPDGQQLTACHPPDPATERCVRRTLPWAPTAAPPPATP